MSIPIGPSDIGTAGQVGFGVGVSLPALPAGYTYLGTTDRNAPNFGRYLNASAQPETWVPACWLRIGSTESPRYAEFGVDAVDVLPLRAYYNLPDAAADGYFLHPALDVDKQVQSGFFAGVSLVGDQADYVGTLQAADDQALILGLFDNGEQGARYAPYDLSSMFQDAAGTIPVTADGDPVGLMLDKSGNGNHASQSTAPARPLYKTDGTLHWIEFDGVDDFMVTASFAWGSDEAFMSVGLTRRSTISRIVYELSSGVGSNPGSFYLASGEIDAQQYTSLSRGSAGSNITIRSSVVSDTPPSTNIVSALHDISDDMSVVRADGVDGATATGDKGAGNFGTYPLYLCARNGGGVFLNGDLFGGVLRNVNPNVHELSAVETYLAVKSGITLP